MVQPSKINLEGYKKLGLAFGLCFFLGFTAMAQGEKERTMSDSPKNVDVVVVPFESHEGSLDNRGENTAKVGPLVKQNPATIKKDTPSTKQEGKKEEISTLSFNLFLYIVDKFKED